MTTGGNSIVSSKSNPIRERFTTMLNCISIRRLLATVILVIALCGLYGVSFASASGDSNNVCLNGVPTKAKFLECYNTNASARALYNSLGITEEGINEAKKDKTCADGKTQSYGRNYTPGSAKVTPDGNTFYRRSLASVMKGCADSWRVHTKNGDVWVLWFCGNPETKSCSCHKRSPSKKAKKYKLYLLKKAQGGTYPSQATFKVTIGSAKAKTVKVTPNTAKSLGSCKKNSKAKVTETNVAAGWHVKGNKTQTYKCSHNKTFTFTNVKNEKKDKGCESTNTNSGSVSGVGFVQGSCNDVNIHCDGQGSCSPTTTIKCTSAASGGSSSGSGNGGNATSTVSCDTPAPSCSTCGTPPTCNTCTPPPPCDTCNPPATPPSCTSLVLTRNNTKTGLYGSGLGVTATSSFKPGDDTLNNVTYTAYDSMGHQVASTTTTSSAVNFTFTKSGTYSVSAVGNFTQSGPVSSDNCKQSISVQLTCPHGETPNTDQTYCVKEGGTTPPANPPSNPAPGTDPDPSPEEPYPGGYACYSNSTGAPVTPVVINGVPACPAGSTGVVVAFARVQPVSV